MKTEYLLGGNEIPDVGECFTFYGSDILMRVSNQAFAVFPWLEKDGNFMSVSLNTGLFYHTSEDAKFTRVEPVDGIIKFKSCN